MMSVILIFLCLSLVSLVTNGATMVYIVKSFDVRTHVFTLLLVDSAVATASSGRAAVLEFL